MYIFKKEGSWKEGSHRKRDKPVKKTGKARFASV
jgi:hypothetical protein